MPAPKHARQIVRITSELDRIAIFDLVDIADATRDGACIRLSDAEGCGSYAADGLLQALNGIPARALAAERFKDEPGLPKERRRAFALRAFLYHVPEAPPEADWINASAA